MSGSSNQSVRRCCNVFIVLEMMTTLMWEGMYICLSIQRQVSSYMSRGKRFSPILRQVWFTISSRDTPTPCLRYHKSVHVGLKKTVAALYQYTWTNWKAFWLHRGDRKGYANAAPCTVDFARVSWAKVRLEPRCKLDKSSSKCKNHHTESHSFQP